MVGRIKWGEKQEEAEEVTKTDLTFIRMFFPFCLLSPFLPLDYHSSSPALGIASVCLFGLLAT